MINVFVVDDHQIFRDGIGLLLKSAADMTLIGQAGSGADALEQLKGTTPNVILMDIQMPGDNGIDVARKVKALYPNIAILMLTMFDDSKSVFEAMKAGASGYILKGVGRDEMLGAIRTVAAGGAIFSPGIADRMMAYFTQDSIESKHPTPIIQPLSSREHEVLQLLAHGHPTVVIAHKLTVTPKTVRNYVSQILKKLRAADRSQAIIKAQQAGLV